MQKLEEKILVFFTNITLAYIACFFFFESIHFTQSYNEVISYDEPEALLKKIVRVKPITNTHLRQKVAFCSYNI